MTHTTATSTDTFRIPFWRMYLPAAVCAQVLFVPLMALMFRVTTGSVGWNVRTRIELYVLAAAAVAGLLVPAFLVYVRFFRVRAMADGLTCPNDLGKLTTAPWGSITRVRRFILPGFSYLLISITGSRFKLWLPLFLDRFPEFVASVEEHAGSDHVLYQHLWRYTDDR
jgi:hypothetical protein